MSMPNINRRLRRLELRRAARSSEWCSECGAYIGTRATDFEIMPPETPPCRLCGSPLHVQLRLGRGRVLSLADDEAELEAMLEDSDDEE